jgi:hypothetical protein
MNSEELNIGANVENVWWKTTTAKKMTKRKDTGTGLPQ